MGRIRFISHINKWEADTEQKLDFAVLQMATDIHRVSAVLAPKASRALVNSGRISREGQAHYKVIYGGGAVPYARIRHYINKKNPQTLRYLENAGDSTSRNFKRYIKDI